MPLGAVAIEIGMRALAGVKQFEIRLDPAELGRVDVRLDIGDDGSVKTHLTVDKVETLALLQREGRTLERAFEQAGLKPSTGGLDLTLRDQQMPNGGRGGGGGERRAAAGLAWPTAQPPAARATMPAPAGFYGTAEPASTCGSERMNGIERNGRETTMATSTTSSATSQGSAANAVTTAQRRQRRARRPSRARRSPRTSTSSCCC